MRCPHGYRHNDITGLIIGKPNMGTTSLSICALTPNYVAEKETENDTAGNTGNRAAYLHFAHLMALLGLADLRIHTGTWTRLEAGEHIFTATPYSRHRINLMLNDAINKPGYYLAGLAGKIMFRRIREQCLQVATHDCDARLHQRVVNLGPLPFSLLDAELSDQWSE